MKNLFCAAALLFAAQGAFAEGPFKSLKFQDALALAKKENKLVFIDFYTTWCGPCKKLDKTTWKDPGVVSWLQEKTVALKLDAEIETKLAEQYKVEGYPYLVFIKPDGAALSGIMGYRNAEDFLKNANEIVSGVDPLEKEKQALAAKMEKDPMARMRYGNILMRQAEYDQALEAFLWCWDEGPSVERGFGGVRNSFLASTLTRLARKHAPAREALETRRDAVYEKIEQKTAAKNDYKDAQLLNRALGRSQDTLKLFDTLDDPELKKTFGAQIYRLLLQERRYEDIAAAVDMKKQVDNCFDRYEELMAEKPTEDMPRQDLEEMAKGFVTYSAPQHYQVLLGLKRMDEAAALAKRILAVDNGPATYERLAWNGYLSGNASPANLEQAKQAHKLTEGKDAGAVKTLAHLMANMNQKDQALKILEGAVAQSQNKREKKMLAAALEEIQAL